MTTATAGFDLDSLPQALRETLPCPHAFHSGEFDPSAMRRLRDRRALGIMDRDEACTAVLRDGGKVEGFACWTWLRWDSAQFGFPAARLDFLLAEGDYFESRRRKSVLLDLVEAQCYDAGIRHLTARVEAGDFATIHALEHCGFDLVDAIQAFGIDLNTASAIPPAEGIAIRPFREEDLAEVREIARSAFVYDRFHADFALERSAADRVNEAWLENSCRGDGADSVLVAEAGGRPLGYAACRIERDTEELLGTAFGCISTAAAHPDAQRRGVSTALTAAALEWFRSRHVRYVEAGVQLRNLPGARLYQSCGFQTVGAQLTLRRVL